MHTDLEIQVPTVENLALSNVLHLRPGIGQNVAMHASPFAINDKLLSVYHSVLCLCVLIIVFMLSLLVLLMVVLLTQIIFYIFLSLHFFFLPIYISSRGDCVWLTLKIKPKN